MSPIAIPARAPRLARPVRQALLAAVMAAALAPRAHAQLTPARPWAKWRTVETKHFAVHYPAELTDWSRDVVGRLEGIDSAVAALVGNSPRPRTRIVVDDPFSLSNGMALSFLDRPVITFWAAPPSPRSEVGDSRTWGEMVAVHEFAHIAHLTQPSRNPVNNLRWRLSPLPLGPITTNAPRWVIEGYATFVEGRVTGTGRPHNAWRAAVLRQWALEGALPSYGELNGAAEYEGGAYAYLVGSAYLEWLAARKGDSSLVHVWRRMTAKEPRTFDQAFAGVFGESPAYLYGQFTAELTARALAADTLLTHAGLDTGTLEQHLTYGTGDPALSRDGKRMALVIRAPDHPALLVVWSTDPEPDTARARRDSTLLAEDPQDVPAKPIYPTPRRIRASLVGPGGMPYFSPRFLPDGRILVSRPDLHADGTIRPDLFIWDWRFHRVDRVTHGAGISDADPSPDGRSAAATRCHAGRCDLVWVDLRSGLITTIVPGSLDGSWFRPRWSPDGQRLVASRQAAGRWHLELVDPVARTTRVIPDSTNASRYDATFLADGRLVATSDRSGIPQLVSVDTITGVERPFTRVTGAAVGAEADPRDSTVWFLSLHSRGYDLRRISLGDVRRDTVVAMPAALFPAVRVRNDSARALPIAPVPPDHGYGLGARVTRWLPVGEYGADRGSAGLALVNSDIVGRLTVTALGEWSDGPAPRGGRADVLWRGWRTPVRLTAFDARQDLTRKNVVPLAGALTVEDELEGGDGAIELSSGSSNWAQLLRAGGSRANVTANALRGTRELAYAHVSERFTSVTFADRWTLDLDANGTTGRTNALAFKRLTAAATVTIGDFDSPGIALSVVHGRVSPGADGYEQFRVGGTGATLVPADALSQRVAVPALPTGVASGDRVLLFRAALPSPQFTPYYTTVSTRDGPGRFERWHRVIGAETVLEEGLIPLVGLPPLRAIGGAAYSYDPPVKGRVQVYFAVHVTE